MHAFCTETDLAKTGKVSFANIKWGTLLLHRLCTYIIGHFRPMKGA